MVLNEFFDFYQTKRHCCLDLNSFSSLLIMFPAAKVAMADGEFSEFEKQNLVAALKEACQGNDLLMCEMYLEMCYLLNVDGEMLQELHTCMRTELDGKADVKLIVLELMISTAESDNGISEVEKQKIDEYKSLLNI